MSQGRVHRRSLAAGPVAALLLSGCGIPESDVIEAGGPAHVQNFVSEAYGALLFFRLPHGDLAPVTRQLTPVAATGEFGGGYQEGGGTVRPPTTEKVISALLHGPGPADRAAGLDTALPRVPDGTVRVRFSVGTSASASGSGSGSGGVVLDLPLAVAGLDATAVRQLICTAAYSKDRDGRVPVRLTGRDGATTSGTCDVDPQPGNAPAPAGTDGRTVPGDRPQ
ncbi:hypothetical protein [Streptomyces candidus]|uniref:Lipoprotein n=1 Tax=Streptomyces candidus TaxID=67283 RepID=A0A7X0HM48_9ACTN|nr:hypothetical protein [Streptomyces candidus]MBB6438668.1 hypothetical protein [Streptomyces candidus]GHH45115.1 lipoprotein [Streptomyces candidus]